MKYSAIIAVFALVVSVSAARSTGAVRDSNEILKDVIAEAKRSFETCVGYANTTADQFVAAVKTNGAKAASLLSTHIQLTRGKADHILAILAHSVENDLDEAGDAKVKRQASYTSSYLKTLIDMACAQFYDIAYNAGSNPDEYTQIVNLNQELTDNLHKELQGVYGLLNELATPK